MRKVRFLGFVVLAVALSLVVGSPPAGAGGWVVTSLDPLPQPDVGRPAEVGFTLLGHGVTPVRATAEEADELGFAVIVRSADGQVSEFPVTPDGTPGHFVSKVTFPAAGAYTWAVRTYGNPMELGEVVVEASKGPALAASAPAAATEVGPSAGGDEQPPMALRLALPALAVAALVLLAVDVAGMGRRDEAAAPAGAA
jgi:hypothetical protein